MLHPIQYLFLFVNSFVFGIPLTIQGLLIVVFHKKIIPFPIKLLYWIGIIFIGKKKSKEQMVLLTTPKEIQRYAQFALISGPLLTIIGISYLLKFLSSLPLY